MLNYYSNYLGLSNCKKMCHLGVFSVLSVRLENPKDHHRTIRTNKFSKAGGCRMNIQKTVVFLYATTKHLKNKTI